MLFSGQDLLCPIVQQPLRRVLENTNVLIKYYQYMALSTCLKNMSISCIPPAAYSATGIFKALPSVSVRNASVVLVSTQREREREICVARPGKDIIRDHCAGHYRFTWLHYIRKDTMWFCCVCYIQTRQPNGSGHWA